MPRAFGSRELAQEHNCEAFGRCGDALATLRPLLWCATCAGDLPLARRLQRVMAAIEATQAAIRQSNELLERRPRGEAAAMASAA